MEVHQETIDEQAEAVLDFWLRQMPPERRFARDEALDQQIAELFGDLVVAVAAGHAGGWRGRPRPLLAAVILLDQFSRNIWRGRAEAFANDPLARALTGEALAKGWDGPMSQDERRFLYMPLMHCERLDAQVQALPLFKKVDANSDEFARLHCAQIARFGRFPGRNEALGRDTTPAEAELLEQPGAGF